MMKRFLIPFLALALCPPAQAFWWDKYPSEIEARQAMQEWLDASGTFDYEYQAPFIPKPDKGYEEDLNGCLVEQQEVREERKRRKEEWDPVRYMEYVARYGVTTQIDCRDHAQWMLERRTEQKFVILTRSKRKRECQLDETTRQYVCYEAQLRNGAKYSEAPGDPYMPEFKVVKRFKW